MGKSNFYSYITTLFTWTLLLCSCQSSIEINPVVGGVDYSIEDEPEVIQLVEEPTKTLSLEDKKNNHRTIYRSFVGVREETGKNDGPEVEKFLAHEGLGKGYAWCAAFVSYCLDLAGFENTINAWSPTAHRQSNLVYNQGKFFKEPEPGHVFTIYYSKKKRIGHTGYYDGWASPNIIQTVEGNTNAGKSREGDGVYVILRPINTIHSISSWYE